MKENGKTIIDMLRGEFTEAERQQMFMEDGFDKGFIKGREAGHEEATERLNKLGILLEEAGREKDVFHAMRDPAFQQQLLEGLF